MKNIHALFKCICVLTVSLAATDAWAWQWKIGAHAGLPAGGRLESAGSVGGGAQVIYNFTDIYSLEMAVSRYKAEPHDGDDTETITSSALTGRVHLSPLTLDAAVYIGAGVGLYAVEWDDSGTDTERDDSMRVRPHVALGLDYLLRERWELFVDYRFAFIHLLHQDNFNHGFLRAGFNYSF